MITKTIFLASILTFLTSCKGQEQEIETKNKTEITTGVLGDTVTQVDGEIRAIFEDKENNIWFASNGNGVFKYDGITIINYTEKHGLASNFVWMIAASKDGKIWFKTRLLPLDSDAICYYDGYGFKTMPVDTGFISYDFNTGELLFAYYYNGTFLTPIQLPHTSPIKNEFNQRFHYDIYASCKDTRGRAWLGTCSAGLCKYDGKNYTWSDNKELGAPIRDIYEDSKGVVWVGNNGDGLFRYNGTEFINFSREMNVHNPNFDKYPVGKPGFMSRIWKITEDPQNNLWIATIDNGIWKYNGEKLINYTTENGLPIDSIWTIVFDQKGNLWVGTAGAGVYTFDGEKFVKFEVK